MIKRSFLCGCLVASSCIASAHAMLQMAVYDIERTLELSSTSLALHYKATITSDTKIPVALPFMDTDGDGSLSDHDTVGMSRLCLDNLGVDLAVYCNNDLAETTTVSAELIAGGREGFRASLRTTLLPRPADITTESITIIDPAFMFPPLDVNRTWDDTTIRTTDESVLVGEDNQTKKETTMKSSPTNIIIYLRR